MKKTFEPSTLLPAGVRLLRPGGAHGGLRHDLLRRLRRFVFHRLHTSRECWGNNYREGGEKSIQGFFIQHVSVQSISSLKFGEIILILRV